MNGKDESDDISSLDQQDKHVGSPVLVFVNRICEQVNELFQQLDFHYKNLNCIYNM